MSSKSLTNILIIVITAGMLGLVLVAMPAAVLGFPLVAKIAGAVSGLTAFIGIILTNAIPEDRS